MGRPPCCYILVAALTIIVGVISTVHAELTPPYFNLAEGRKIHATATCGVDTDGPELFCKLVGANTENEVNDYYSLLRGQVCDMCDSSDPSRRHPPEYAIDGTEQWWQSPPLSRGMRYNEVNLTIDFGQEFHVAYVFIRMGNSPRPGAFSLEKSMDHGKTWTPWQHFSDSPSDCETIFKGSVRSISRDDDVICTNEYSKIVPLENGEIPIMLLNNRPSSNNYFNSTVLQEWTRATNIRIRLIRTKNLLGHLMSVARQDPSVTRRYFYSIKDISIGGRCMCNGHANNCNLDSTSPNRVLACQCQHNTCGIHCAECCPGFEQKKWKQNTNAHPFRCEPCNCHGHTSQCKYDEEVDRNRQSLDIHGNYDGGGVCQNCQHNTMGINCNECTPKYYRPRGRYWNETDVCQPCNCDRFNLTGNCEEETGICECRKEYQKPNCDDCAYGYYGYPHCKPCDCRLEGTVGYQCQPDDGQCHCKSNFAGHFCERCADGYYNYPECVPCECEDIGSVTGVCHESTGECQCKSNFAGKNCDTCKNGYFDYPTCTYCNCDIRGTLDEVCDQDTGKCLCREGFGGSRCDQCVSGFFNYPDCEPCDCSLTGSPSSSCDSTGKCHCTANFAGRQCNLCSAGYYQYPECLPCNCDLHGSTGVSCNAEGQCFCKDNFDGKNCNKCKEGFYNYPACEECNCDPAGVVTRFGGCGSVPEGELCQCKSRVTGRICNECKPLYWNLNVTNPDGCQECDCFTDGTVGALDTCDLKTGQCACKPTVNGRTCDQCEDGMFDLFGGSLFGCKDCGCDIGGAISDVCDKTSGQCRCHQRVTGRTCNYPLTTYYYPTLYQYQYEYENGRTPAKAPVRFQKDQIVFPEFSGKGYAHFSQLMHEVENEVHIKSSSVYRMIIRYHNTMPENIVGTITIQSHNYNEADQIEKVLLKPTESPQFITVSGTKGDIPWAIVLDPGYYKFTIKIEKQAFLDYFVLLPAAYYEATVLSKNVQIPCEVGNLGLCKHFKYPSISQFSPVTKAHITENDEVYDPAISYEDFEHLNVVREEAMPALSEDQMNLNYILIVPKTGRYIVVVDYITERGFVEPTIMGATMAADTESDGVVTVYPCFFTMVCRQPVVDVESREKIFFLTAHEPRVITLRSEGPNRIGVKSVTAIPVESWSLEYINPNQVAVIQDSMPVKGRFSVVADSKRVEFEADNMDRVAEQNPLEMFDNSTKLIYLNKDNSSITVSSRVNQPGRYVLLVKYYNPDHPHMDVFYRIDTDTQNWEGKLKVAHCPSNIGCRMIVDHKGSTVFDINEAFTVTLTNNNANGIWLDFVLLVPFEVFHEGLMREDDFDQTKEFLHKCANDHFHIAMNASDFCRASVFSITADHNRGALPCGCNVDGSISLECDPFGGQCQCKENVINRECDECRDNYYDFPNCKKCSCPFNARCHPVTGECICPDGVMGEKCDQCAPLTFGFDSLTGCEACNCNPEGVLYDYMQCDLNNGSCTCKSNVVGRHCDQCERGFYNYPYCEPCSCDHKGTTFEICDARDAACYCKKNTAGRDCRDCTEGTYNLQESNPEGCTKCFCFGKTTRCHPAYLRPFNVSMLGEVSVNTIVISPRSAVINRWKVDMADHRVNETMLKVDKVEQSEGLVYFGVLDFLLNNNNHLTAYGGKLTYRLLHTNGLFGDALIGPDVIFSGKDEVYIHQSYEQPANNVWFHGSVDMIESNFQTISGAPVTRDQFMTLLRDTKEIFIRANYWESTMSSQLSDVYLTMADQDHENYNLYQELAVESCECPVGYKGLSCEDCAPGFFRDKNGPHGGYCIPCQCNGHADTCDCNTGICHDCKHGTTGDHCEFCVEGYYGNATYGTPYDCMICACPLPVASNNFAHSCEVSDDGNLISCNCREGYTGATCSSCAAGYFGDPRIEGEVCRPCECSGNIDPHHPDSCDSLTGECKLCLNNTAGTACNLCKPFFYGNALAKDCKSCDCDETGTDFCDNSVGTCHCLPNVVGEKCDRCEDDHYAFDSRRGCRACDCGVAAYSTQCADQTGECRCKPGVTGRQCDRCTPGFFNYTSDGCVPCLCNTDYSRGLGCNPHTGQCECLPGVVGKNCDHCPHRWVLIPDTGCNQCDICHHALLDVTDALKNELDPVIEEFHNVAGGYFTAQKLTYLNDMADQIEPDVRALDPKGVNLNPANSAIESLEQEAKNYDRRLGFAQKNADELSGSAKSLVQDAANVSSECASVHHTALIAIRDVDNLANSLESAELTRVDRAKSEAEQILGNINEVTIDLEPAENQRSAAEDMWTESGVLKLRATNPVKDLELLKNDTQTLQNRLTDMNALAETSNGRSWETERLNAKNKQVTLNTKFETVGNHLKETSEHLGEGKQKLKDAEDALKALAENIKTLDQNNYDMKALNGEVEDLLPNKEDVVNSKESIVAAAQQHAEKLKVEAEELRDKIDRIESDSGQSLRAAQAYSNIVDHVNEAQKAVAAAKNAAGNATEIGDGIDQRAAKSDQTSSELLDDAMRALDKVQVQLGPHLNKSRQTVNEIIDLNKDSDNKLAQINAALEHITDDSQTSSLENAKNVADKSNQKAQKALKMMKPIVKSVADDTKRAQDLPVEMDKTNKDIANIRKQVADVATVVPDIHHLVDNLENRQNKANMMVSRLGDKLSQLRSQVDTAREIANSINLGVAFHPNTTLELKTPENLQLLATNSRFSTYFRTEKPNGFVVYLGNEEQPAPEPPKKAKPQDFMALEIENGYPVLSVDLGYGPERLVSDKFVADGQWRQAIVDRVGNNIQLTIREELENGSEKLHQVNQTLPGPYSVFNVDQDSRLFVGGYPPDFNIQNGVKYSSFEGEIEELKIGDDQIGLWNFVDGQSNTNGARERNKLYSNEKPTTGYRFSGNGYAVVDAKPFSFKTRSRVQFRFKATKETNDGLMFYVGGDLHFMSIELRDGTVVFQFKMGQKLVTFRTPKKYNDDRWHDVEAVRDGPRGKLVVDQEVRDSVDTADEEYLMITDVMYFGGHPGEIPHGEVTNSGFDGCIDNVSIESTPVDLTRNQKAIATRRGCPTKFSSGVTFVAHNHGYAKRGNVSADNFLQVYMRFRTKHEEGVLFYVTNNDQSSTLGLALVGGQLYLTTSTGESINSKRLNDGEWHTVTATHGTNDIRLSIDDALHYKSEFAIPPLQIHYGEIFFGGLPNKYVMGRGRMKTSAYFIGCISDANVNGGGVNFAEVRDKERARLDYCPAELFDYNLWTVPNVYPEGTPDDVIPDIDRRTQPTDDKMNEIDDKEDEPMKPFVPPVVTKPPRVKPTTDARPWPTRPQAEVKTGCQLSADKFDWDMDFDMFNGYRFGLKKDSRVEIRDVTMPKRKAYDFYLEFKTESPDGILFYASDARHHDFVALYMVNGKLVHSFRASQGMINTTSNYEYHNGEWHTVMFTRSQNASKMVVDGDDVTVFEAQQQIRQVQIQAPFYVGGISAEASEDAHLNMKTDKAAHFKGCIRGLNINARPPSDPKTIDVYPCTEQVEPGTFFSGGYVRLREKLRVGTDIRISMEIKARTQNGLLLSVHGKKALLILQLLNGTVSFVVDNGDGVFETVFVPEEKNLCDGEWHSIVAIKTKFVITLQVDNVQSQPTIGPTKTPSAETSRALFLGGHQHISRIRGLKAREPYQGCIRNVKIDDKPEKVTNDKVTGDVLVGVCPTF